MDILPVQASAVPCERVFSSSKDTITPQRSRLSGITVEMLQILKYRFKRKRLNFLSDELANEIDYTLEGPITVHAASELVATSQFEELKDLFRNV
jgi:hypothetical protein